MRWPPWKRTERRTAADYSDAVVRLIEAQAAESATDIASTAAVEAAAGALSRAFASATVEGPEYIRAAVTPGFLGQVGRDLIRSGESLHVIDVDAVGGVSLLPASSWTFEGAAHPRTWTVRVTYAGPTTTTSHRLPFAGVVFVAWGAKPSQPHRGIGPTSWASTTARLQSETERSLADEAAGPLAQLLAIPQDGGDGEDGDPLKSLKADMKGARGKALLVETTAAGWGEGMASAPRRDWTASRLGPDPPASLAEIRRDTFEAVLAATGTPPALFTDADGTAQREGLRRWHLGTVQPLARVVAAELSAKLEGSVGLSFDTYPLDVVGRAGALKRLIDAGVDRADALRTVGLDGGGE